MRPLARVIGAFRRSLKLKLILFVIATLGVTVGVAPWAAIRAQRQQLLDESERHARAIEDMLRALIDASMLAKDQAQVQQVLETVGSHEGVTVVRIFDTDGIIHFSARPDERGRRLSADEMMRLRAASNPMAVTEEGNPITHTLLQPLFNKPTCVPCHTAERKVLGILQLTLSLDQVSQQLAELRKSALTATLISLGVIAVGLWLALTLLVDQPLQRLVATMVRVETGDLSVRAPAQSADEIGQLSGHFNKMVAELDVAHQELQQYHKEQMVRSDRLATVGQMAAAIAHEVRNPLTGISGALSVLGRGFDPQDPRRDVVRQTRLLIDRLNKTVEDILEYSRPSPPHVQATDVKAIVERSVSLVESEAKRAGVQFVHEANPPADSDAAAPHVRVDPHQIQQVLMNLMLNAIQATGAGGQVRVRTQVTGNHGGDGWVCVAIQDTGKGMTAEEVSKVFDPFYSTKAHGTGLGLSIARQIIEQHHGVIRIESAPGSGTVVTVELPAHAPTEPGSVDA